MVAVCPDDAAEHQVYTRCDERRANRQRNEVYEEGVLFEDLVVHPDSAAVANELAGTAYRHANHEAPGLIAYAETGLSEHEDEEDGEVDCVAGDCGEVGDGATLDAACLEGAVLGEDLGAARVVGHCGDECVMCAGG